MVSRSDFMLAVREAFPELPDGVVETEDGFEVVTERRSAGDAAVQGHRDDRRSFVVTADEATGVFSVDHRRAIDQTLDRRGRTRTGYEVSRKRGGYRGTSFTMSFSRTPQGLLPVEDDPTQTTTGKARIREAAARTGWREDPDSAGIIDPTSLGDIGPALAQSFQRIPKWAVALLIGVPVVIIGVLVIVLVAGFGLVSRFL